MMLLSSLLFWENLEKNKRYWFCNNRFFIKFWNSPWWWLLKRAQGSLWENWHNGMYPLAPESFLPTSKVTTESCDQHAEISYTLDKWSPKTTKGFEVFMLQPPHFHFSFFTSIMRSQVKGILEFIWDLSWMQKFLIIYLRRQHTWQHPVWPTSV